MPIAVLVTMLGYMLVCSFTPGPGNILALNTTTQFGWQKGKRLIFVPGILKRGKYDVST